MKKTLFLSAFVALLTVSSCESDPKLTEQEEKAVNDLMEDQQKKQDSLEKVLMEHMDSLGVPDPNDSL